MATYATRDSENLAALIAESSGSAGIVTFPAAAIPADGVSQAEVLRQVYAALEGTAASQNGVATWPASAAPGNNVSIAEVLGWINDAIQGTNGVVTWPTAAAYANAVSIAEVLAYIQDGVRKGSGTAMATNKSIADALGTDGTTVTDSAVSVLGAIGANSADNTFSSSSVVANVDGSVLERLEALMDPLGGYNPRLGFGVTKVSNLADGAGTDNLFTVTGRVLITSLTGEVTTVVGTTTTMKLRDVTNSVDLCAATTITTDAVGTMYALTSISTNILNGTGATPVIGSIPNITGATQTDVAVIGCVQAPITVAHVLDGAGTGAVTWRLTYIPLVSGATVAAAA